MNSQQSEPATGTAWLPLSEAAAIAGISVRAMQKRAANGKIGAQKIGTGAAARWEIDGRELDANHRTRTANQFANCEPIGREPEAVSGTFEREIGRGLDANRESTGREPVRELAPDREAELKSEIAFLRGIVESDRRDMAEIRAALREALKLAPKQLPSSGAAPLDGATAGELGRVAAPARAQDREHFDGSAPTTAKQPRAQEAPIDYNAICDWLEKETGEIK